MTICSKSGLNSLFFKEHFYLIIISQGTDNIGVEGSNARDDDISLVCVILLLSHAERNFTGYQSKYQYQNFLDNATGILLQTCNRQIAGAD